MRHHSPQSFVRRRRYRSPCRRAAARSTAADRARQLCNPPPGRASAERRAADCQGAFIRFRLRHSHVRSSPSIRPALPPADRRSRSRCGRSPSTRCPTARGQSDLERFARTIKRRHIHPTAARLQLIHNATDHAPIIDTQRARYIRRQKRRQSRKLPFAQAEIIAHRFALLLKNANHTVLCPIKNFMAPGPKNSLLEGST